MLMDDEEHIKVNHGWKSNASGFWALDGMLPEQRAAGQRHNQLHGGCLTDQ